MNLPIKKPILVDIEVENIMPKKLFVDLSANNFDGFINLTNNTDNGFEEGFIIFEKGKITGCMYFVDFYDIHLYGKEGFDYSVNLLGAKKGILNIFELSEDQIKLVLLFNNKIKYELGLITKKELRNKKYFLNNLIYNDKLLPLLLKDKINVDKSQKELLDQRGLDDLLNF
jgi:hypothetical protein